MEFVRGLIVLLIFLLCGGCYFTPEEAKKAIEACEPFGGLEMKCEFACFKAHCKDGTKISLP